MLDANEKMTVKISLAKTAGFCFGVRRAINIALEEVKTNHNIEMLGDIVHNEDVVRQIKKAGIKKISNLKNGRNKTLLIRAHGASKQTIEKAKELKYSIIDATCPMVKEIHKIAQEMESEGCRIIIIGDKKHDEVLGINGQLKNKAIIIDGPNSPLPKSLAKIKKAAIVVQSTQNLDVVEKIVLRLKPLIKHLKFFNTICRPTRTKQEEIKTMPKENDVMIIIGSLTSANTKRLYEISKSLNKNSHWIHSKNGLNKNWFASAKSIGIASGASTPGEITQSIIERIKLLTRNQKQTGK